MQIAARSRRAIGGIERPAIVHGDKGRRPHSERRIRQADQRRLADAGLAAQRLFDIARIPSLAGHDHQFGTPAAQRDEAVSVDHPEIAGAQPAAAGGGFAVLSGLPQ